jgi:integrase
MASIRKRTVQGKPVYDVLWRDPKQRGKSFAKLALARDFKTQIENELRYGSYINPSAGKVVFRDYAETWRLASSHRATTAQSIKSSLTCHVYPVIGDCALSSIRPAHIRELQTRMAKSLTPSSICTIRRYVSAVFSAAIADKLIHENPLASVKAPKVEPRPIVLITTGQLVELIEKVPAPYRALIILAAGTGLRQGEAFGVTRDRIDFDQGVIIVNRQLTPIGEFGPLKTASSYRKIPLPLPVLARLKTHIELYPNNTNELLFLHHKAGTALRRTSFGVIWRKARTEANLPDNIGFHALRHYYASLLIAGGASVKAVQSRLGHATSSETLDTYAHLWPDDDYSTRNIIETAWGLGADWPALPV